MSPAPGHADAPSVSGAPPMSAARPASGSTSGPDGGPGGGGVTQRSPRAPEAARDPALVRTVGVIGAGTMGSGIAHVFAGAGRRVLLSDTDPEALSRGLDAVARNLERQARKGGLGESPADVLRRIEATSGTDALTEADLVVEAIAEDERAKRSLFRRLDEVAPPASILASNTSAISITALAAATRRPALVIGMHFMNPVPVMPLVEVVAGLDTSPATLDLVCGLCRDLGKTPVAVRDAPGFVSNRVLMPMINEAVFCLDEGVADAGAVDQVLKLGMRHPMGPLELADLIGLDVCLAILEVLHRELGEDKYRPCPLLRRKVAAGHLGRKSGRGFHDYGNPPSPPC